MKFSKWFICLTIIAAIVFMSLSLIVSARIFLRGDADGDGRVTVIDATVIQKVRASIEVKSFDELAADVDDDNVVSVLDATYIQKSLAHIDIDYAVGETVVVEDPTQPQTDAPTEPQTDAPTQPQTQAPSYKPGDNELPYIPNR